jgi:RNA polymerase sigma-70 factor, ECF subfamily
VLAYGRNRVARIPPSAACVVPRMETTLADAPSGQFEARYLAFLETVTHLRPSLHRYCSRMTGSVFDGEDVAQDALFQAYRKLDTFDDTQPLAPWLFRIAHNRCIDFLRRRNVRESAEAEADAPEFIDAVDPPGPLGRAVEHLVLTLPPKERACVLLKDVFDYSLEEIADVVDSTVGGVKSALNRGRAKLAARPNASGVPVSSRTASPEVRRLLHLYAERFNRRDWEGLRELIAADARLRVADRFLGPLAESPYFGRWDRRTTLWRASVGEVGGEAAIVIALQDARGEWAPRSAVRLGVSGGRIERIDDYLHCPWVFAAGNLD